MLLGYKTIEVTPLSRIAPRAVTFLCKKISFSIVGNALTFYPYFSRVSQSIIHDVIKTKAKKTNLHHEPVYNDYLEHDAYHQDHLSRYSHHYHWHFKQNITIPVLTEILELFLEKEVITAEEKQDFLLAFNNATLIPADEFEKIVTDTCFIELRALVRNKYSSKQHPDFYPKLTRILDDFTRLIHEGKHLAKLRHYMNGVSKVLKDPNVKNCNYLKKIAKNAGQIWPVLGTTLLAVSVIMLASGICLGGTAGIVMGSAGAAFFLSGAYAVKKHYAQEKRYLKDHHLSQDLSTLERSLRRA
jgi:hypothetical protein